MSFLRIIKTHVDGKGELHLNKSMTKVMIQIIETMELEIINLRRQLGLVNEKESIEESGDSKKS